jgi:hypothetical protein
MGKPDVRLRMFPADDPTFEMDVTAAIQDAALEVGEDELIAAVADRLRGRYRQLSIVPQNDLARLEIDPAPTWYVFRDGRIRPGQRNDEDELER